MASKAVFVCVVIFCSLQILEGSVLVKSVREAEQVNLAGFDPISSIKNIIKDIEQKAKDAIQKGEEGIKIVKELFNDTIHGNEEKVKELLEQVLANITKSLPPGIKFGVEVTECTANATLSAFRVATNTMKATLACSVDDINDVLKPLIDVYNASAALIKAGGILANGAAECFKDVSAWTITGDLICFINKLNSVKNDLLSSVKELMDDLKKSGSAIAHLRENIRNCPKLRIADAVIEFGKIIEDHAQCVENYLNKSSARAVIRCTTDEISAILGPLFDLVSGGSQLLQIIGKAFEAMTCFKDFGISTIFKDIECFNKEVKSIMDQSGGYITKLVADTKKAIEALTHVKDAVVKCPPTRLAESIIGYGKVMEQFGDCVQHLVPNPSS